MKIIESEPKILRMFYSAKELAVMMDIGYDTFRAELRRNDVLYAKLINGLAQLQTAVQGACAGNIQGVGVSRRIRAL